MKNKKIISFILGLGLVLPVLSGCALTPPNIPVVPSVPGQDTEPSEGESETETESDSDTTSEEVSGTFVDIEVVEPKTIYTVNDNFVKPQVNALYSDGSEKDVTSSALFSGYNLALAGEYDVIVKYTEGEITKLTSYSIYVCNPSQGDEYSQYTIDLFSSFLAKLTGSSKEDIDTSVYLDVCYDCELPESSAIALIKTLDKLIFDKSVSFVKEFPVITEALNTAKINKFFPAIFAAQKKHNPSVVKTYEEWLDDEYYSEVSIFGMNKDEIEKLDLVNLNDATANDIVDQYLDIIDNISLPSDVREQYEEYVDRHHYDMEKQYNEQMPNMVAYLNSLTQEDQGDFLKALEPALMVYFKLGINSYAPSGEEFNPGSLYYVDYKDKEYYKRTNPDEKQLNEEEVRYVIDNLLNNELLANELLDIFLAFFPDYMNVYLGESLDVQKMNEFTNKVKALSGKHINALGHLLTNLLDEIGYDHIYNFIAGVEEPILFIEENGQALKDIVKNISYEDKALLDEIGNIFGIRVMDVLNECVDILAQINSQLDEETYNSLMQQLQTLLQEQTNVIGKVFSDFKLDEENEQANDRYDVYLYSSVVLYLNQELTQNTFYLEVYDRETYEYITPTSIVPTADTSKVGFTDLTLDITLPDNTSLSYTHKNIEVRYTSDVVLSLNYYCPISEYFDQSFRYIKQQDGVSEFSVGMYYDDAYHQMEDNYAVVDLSTRGWKMYKHVDSTGTYYFPYYVASESDINTTGHNDAYIYLTHKDGQAPTYDELEYLYFKQHVTSTVNFGDAFTVTKSYTDSFEVPAEVKSYIASLDYSQDIIKDQYELENGLNFHITSYSESYIVENYDRCYRSQTLYILEYDKVSKTALCEQSITYYYYDESSNSFYTTVVESITLQNVEIIENDCIKITYDGKTYYFTY